MKVILNGAELSDAVNKVIKATATKTTMPILEGIKLTARANTLTLTATDNELAIEKTVLAEVFVEGETVVPGKFFAEFLRKLTDCQIEIVVTDNNQMIIKYADAESRINCISAADYPEIKRLDGAEHFCIVKREFRDLVTKIAFSVSNDESRAILRGVCLEVEDYTLTGVALDGYRLAKAVKPIESTTAKMSAVVPSRCINEICKLIEDSTDLVSISIQNKYLMVDLGHTRITTRLLDGDFISYRQIIPTHSNSTVTIPKAQLEAALERASLLSKGEKNNLVRFDIHDGMMLISGNSEVGSINEKIVIRLTGLDLAIAFNARYLIELMRYIESEMIVMKFINSSGPAVIVPVDVSDEYLYLVLPVRLLT